MREGGSEDAGVGKKGILKEDKEHWKERKAERELQKRKKDLRIKINVEVEKNER